MAKRTKTDKLDENDAFDKLAHNRSEIQTLFAKLSAEASAERRDELFPELASVLTTNQELEEEAVYPALKEFAQMRSMTNEAVGRHEAMNDLLQEVSEMPNDSRDWKIQLRKLHDAFFAHAQKEDEMFALARKALSSSERRSLAQEIDAYLRGEDGAESGDAKGL